MFIYQLAQTIRLGGFYEKITSMGICLQSMDKAGKMGLPRVGSGVLAYQRSLTLKKRILILTFHGVGSLKGQEIPPMPEQVYVCLKKARGVTFDFLPYNDFFIMSARFFGIY